MNDEYKCEARYEGGSMVCHRCGLSWDYDDKDRPECLLEVKHTTEFGIKLLDEQAI